jgi:hypothetical protein
VAYEERGTGALPRLYGAPAYARPRVVAVAAPERPFDPDDEPLAGGTMDEDAGSFATPAPGPSAWVDIVATVTAPSPAPIVVSMSRSLAAASVEVDAPASVEPTAEVDLPPDVAAQLATVAPVTARPAERVEREDASLGARLGGLFKGRNRGAS